MLELEEEPEAAGEPRVGQPTNLSDHVTAFDREALMQSMFRQIYGRSIILYVLDITNFEGSQIDEIYDLINQKRHRVIVVVNKIDALPKGFTVERLQLWVKRQIEKKFEDHVEYYICLASAKKATGQLKVLEILKKLKN